MKLSKDKDVTQIKVCGARLRDGNTTRQGHKLCSVVWLGGAERERGWPDEWINREHEKVFRDRQTLVSNEAQVRVRSGELLRTTHRCSVAEFG